MGLWEKIDELNEEKEIIEVSEEILEPQEPHYHNGKLCKSLGSCALQNFEQLTK